MFDFLNITIGEIYDYITVADVIMAALVAMALACVGIAAISYANRKKPGHW